MSIEIPSKAADTTKTTVKCLQDLGLKDIGVYVVLDPLGEEKTVILTSALSAKHVVSAGSELIQFLKQKLNILPKSDGLVRNESLKIQRRRLRRKLSKLAVFASKVVPEEDIDAALQEKMGAGSWAMISFKSVPNHTDVHIFTKDRRDEVDLLGLWIEEDHLLEGYVAEERSTPKTISQIDPEKFLLRNYSTTSRRHLHHQSSSSPVTDAWEILYSDRNTPPEPQTVFRVMKGLCKDGNYELLKRLQSRIPAQYCELDADNRYLDPISLVLWAHIVYLSKHLSNHGISKTHDMLIRRKSIDDIDISASILSSAVMSKFTPRPTKIDAAPFVRSFFDSMPKRGNVERKHLQIQLQFLRLLHTIAPREYPLESLERFIYDMAATGHLPLKQDLLAVLMSAATSPPVEVIEGHEVLRADTVRQWTKSFQRRFDFIRRFTTEVSDSLWFEDFHEIRELRGILLRACIGDKPANTTHDGRIDPLPVTRGKLADERLLELSAFFQETLGAQDENLVVTMVIGLAIAKKWTSIWRLLELCAMKEMSIGRPGVALICWSIATSDMDRPKEYLLRSGWKILMALRPVDEKPSQELAQALYAAGKQLGSIPRDVAEFIETADESCMNEMPLDLTWMTVNLR
ncbi:hypothetical protein CANCADRAFT_32337 [Tortispora caseinolytica NRRL Y-17796]|uniref:ATPase synthesis protein 25 n=1 Tax=Tortispora caseinolytica NRRL Y-17796 TaxID=767744 RepID=A0A1E4TAX3_9ASCO|nr:hypothetical protein CANCADRAFT_32337 [Tortispora caseinolytica NRRL Y-17796]